MFRRLELHSAVILRGVGVCAVACALKVSFLSSPTSHAASDFALREGLGRRVEPIKAADRSYGIEDASEVLLASLKDGLRQHKFPADQWILHLQALESL